MVRVGDTIDDIRKYIVFRIKHLELERKRIPTRVRKLDRGKASKTLYNKIEELTLLKNIINDDVKKHSKIEWNECKKIEEELCQK